MSRTPPSTRRRTLRRLSGAVLLTGVSVILVTGLLVTGIVTGAGTAGATTQAATPLAAGRPAGPVVVLGTAGLRWDDLDDTTPALNALLATDAVAALAVRGVRETACPVDGWLTLSAGRRAADLPGAACREPRLEGDGADGTERQVSGWQAYREEASAGSFDADPGLLGATLAAAGRAVAAVGPGAAIATADRQGRTARVWPGVPAGPQGTLDPAGDAAGLTGQVRAAVASGADLVVADLGAVRDVPGGRTDSPTGPASRADQVKGLDSRVGLVAGSLPADATVLVASLADDGTGPHLQLLAAHARASAAGPALAAGLLRSPSTRQDGLAQVTDLTSTVLARLGVAVPAATDGAPLVRVDGGGPLDRRQRVTGLDQASRHLLRLVTPFFVISAVVEAAALLGLGLTAYAARLAPRTRHRALTLLRAVAVTVALVPAATFLANLWPWWRGPLPGTQLVLAVLGATLPLALVAHAGPWRRHPLGPAGVAGALTVAVLAGDVLTGSRLSLAALIGGQPLVAGRFYGTSNPVFGILGTAAVLAALALAAWLHRRGWPASRQALAVAATGLLVTVVDGAPGLGSDVGGPPALVPAFGYLALRVAGVRVTWRRAGLIALAAVATVAVAGLLDHLRPAADRTHLGRFVQSVLDGGAGDVVGRKLAQNLGQLVSSPLTLLVPPAAVLVAVVLWRPDRWRVPALATAYAREPLLRPALAAVGVLLAIGFAVNDSGVSVPPAALLVLAPALVAIAAHALDLTERERREAAAAAARRPARKR